MLAATTKAVAEPEAVFRARGLTKHYRMGEVVPHTPNELEDGAAMEPQGRENDD